MTTSSNVPFFMQCVRCFSRPDGHEDYLQLYDPAIALHGYGLPPGIDAVRAFYGAFWAAFPDVQLRIDDIVEAGDKLVARFACLGTHRGEFMGVPATGRRFEFTGITILRFVDGRCVERWSEANFLSLLQQLGTMPEPKAA